MVGWREHNNGVIANGGNWGMVWENHKKQPVNKNKVECGKLGGLWQARERKHKKNIKITSTGRWEWGRGGAQAEGCVRTP